MCFVLVTSKLSSNFFYRDYVVAAESFVVEEKFTLVLYNIMFMQVFLVVFVQGLTEKITIMKT